MGLVPAKCTQCGASIEVDPNQEAGICKHCGTAFITEKVINNYVTNITNVDKSVNINIGTKKSDRQEEKEELISSLKALADFKDHAAMYENVKKLLKKYPASADAYHACAVAMGKIMKDDLKTTTSSAEVEAVYLGEFKGVDVYVDISYPIGLFERAQKLTKDNNKKEQIKKDEMAFKKAFFKEFISKNQKKYFKDFFELKNREEFLYIDDYDVEDIVKYANTKPVDKKIKAGFFDYFPVDWMGFFAFLTVLAIPALIIAFCIPVSREFLCTYWLITAIIIVALIFGIIDLYVCITSAKEFEDKDNKNRSENVKAWEVSNEELGIKITEKNYWYAMAIEKDIDNNMSHVGHIYRIMSVLLRDVKTGKVNEDDVDWYFVYDKCREALDRVMYDKKKVRKKTKSEIAEEKEWEEILKKETGIDLSEE